MKKVNIAYRFLALRFITAVKINGGNRNNKEIHQHQTRHWAPPCQKNGEITTGQCQHSKYKNSFEHKRSGRDYNQRIFKSNQRCAAIIDGIHRLRVERLSVFRVDESERHHLLTELKCAEATCQNMSKESNNNIKMVSSSSLTHNILNWNTTDFLW